MFQNQAHSIIHLIQAVRQSKTFTAGISWYLLFLHIFAFKAKTYKGDDMIYEIRLKARQKQAQCSAILFLSFMVTVLTVVTANLMPVVYVSAIKPVVSVNKIIPVVLSLVFLSFSVVMYLALSMGIDRFMLKRAENIIAGAGDIFCYFAPKKLLSMCGFYLSLFLRKGAVSLILAMPFTVCCGIFVSMCNKGFSAAVCGVFGVFTVIFFLLFIVTAHQVGDTYFLAKYKYIKGDYLNMKQLFAISQEAMTPKIKRLRQMKLSFAGWFALCILILPVPYVWSYYRQCKACFAAEI